MPSWEVPDKAHLPRRLRWNVARTRFWRNPVRLGLWAYFLTLVLVLAVAAATAALSTFSLDAFGARVRDGAILSGIMWMIAGFLVASSTNTYLGPGAVGRRAPPIVWPADALPVRSEAVLKDLTLKLADPQSLSILFVTLGVFGVLAGFVAYASAALGVIAISIVAAAVAVLLLATGPGRSSRIHG